jgi:hypothetical protein
MFFDLNFVKNRVELIFKKNVIHPPLVVIASLSINWSTNAM